jgi:molecular chaperone GrpE
VNGEDEVIWQMVGGGEGELPGQSAAAQATPAATTFAASAELRGQLVRRIEQWVDRMLAGEPPPEGLPEELLVKADETSGGAGPTTGAPDEGGDLYALFSALTTLSGEIRLQGRAFKQLSELLAPSADLPRRIEQLEAAQLASADQLAGLLDEARHREARRSVLPGGKDVLMVLFDLCDRLERGIATFDAAMEAMLTRNGWLARLTGISARIERRIAATEAMREGYQLTLARLQAALHEWGIQRIGAEGEMFDPQCMTVVEVEESEDEPDGTVLEVYRSGYELHGQVLAVAQVKVAKNAKGRATGLESENH